MANDMQNKVREFHRVGGATIGETPAIRDAELRARLILEEAAETVTALVGGSRANDLFAQLSAKEGTPPDLVEAIDGMCDVLYVIFGTAVACGIDLQMFFDEVHRTNLEKANGPRRADGKIEKPPGWEPPRIREMLEKVIADKPEMLVPAEIEAHANGESTELRVRAQSDSKVIRELIDEAIEESNKPTCISYDYDPTPSGEERLGNVRAILGRMKQVLE